MTASVAEVVLCAALLLAMALWYGARVGAVPALEAPSCDGDSPDSDMCPYRLCRVCGA